MKGEYGLDRLSFLYFIFHEFFLGEAIAYISRMLDYIKKKKFL